MTAHHHLRSGGGEKIRPHTPPAENLSSVVVVGSRYFPAAGDIPVGLQLVGEELDGG